MLHREVTLLHGDDVALGVDEVEGTEGQVLLGLVDAVQPGHLDKLAGLNVIRE